MDSIERLQAELAHKILPGAKSLADATVLLNLFNEVDRLKEIERLRASQFRWIPVGERLPTEADGDWVFTLLPGGSKGETMVIHFKRANYTHWAPIPPLPEKSQEEKDGELWLRWTQGHLGGTTDIDGVRNAFFAGLKAARSQQP